MKHITNKEDFIDFLIKFDPDGYNDYINLERKGIDLSFPQMIMIFSDRRSGKTFSSYSSIMIEASKEGYFKLEKATRGEKLLKIWPEPKFVDIDLLNGKQVKDYILGLRKFVDKYYPEFSIIETKKGIEGFNYGATRN